MLKASSIVDRYYLEMRGKCVALAADIDRIARADGGSALLNGDPRMRKLLSALNVLADTQSEKAQRVQLVFSDRTAGPNAPEKPSA